MRARLAARYELGEVVRETEDTLVIAARDVTLERVVQVRRPRDAADAGAVRERFEARVRDCARLRHPAILPVYDAGRDDHGLPFVVTQIVAGESFEVRLRPDASAAGDAPGDHDALLAVAGRVCGAVAHAHAKGVAHGRLGPDVVRIGKFGRVQVIDWDVPAGGGAAPAEDEAVRRDVVALCRLIERAACVVGGGDAPDAARASLDRLVAVARGVAERNRSADASPAQGAAALAAAVTDHRAAALAAARRSELDTLRAATAAADQRRARRHALAVLGVIAAFVLAAAGVAMLIGQERDTRRRRIADAADLALTEAVTAQDAGDLGAAEAAADRAVRLLQPLSPRGPEPDAALVPRLSRAQTLLAGIVRAREDRARWERRAASDRAALAGLERARVWMQRDPDLTTRRFLAVLGKSPFDVARDPVAAADALAGSLYAEDLLFMAAAWEHFARTEHTDVAAGTIARCVDGLAGRVYAGDAGRRAAVEAVLRALREDDVAALAALDTRAAIDDLPPPLLALAGASLARSDADAGIGLLRAAQVRHPDDPWLHLELAAAYVELPLLPALEILRHLSAAVALRPELPELRVLLGQMALRCGDVATAEESLDVLDVLLPVAARDETARFEAAPREWLRGAVMLERGDDEGAAAASEAAYSADARLQYAGKQLVTALVRLGSFTAAREHAEEVLEEARKRAPDAHPWHERLVEQCREFEELSGRVDEIAAPGRTSDDPGEAAVFARLCLYTGHTAAAARWFEIAGDAPSRREGMHPGVRPGAASDDARAPGGGDVLADTRRSERIESNLRAGCGDGVDAAGLPDDARRNLREKAFDLMQGVLADRTSPVDKLLTLHQWRTRPAYEPVRDESALEQFDAEERGAWRGLWLTVERRFRRLGGE